MSVKDENRQRDVAFDSKVNMMRDVVLGFIHDTSNKRVGMRVWNRATNTVHTHKIPDIDWQAWNLNINGGRCDPKCCNLSDFPIFSLSAGSNGNPLAHDAVLVARNAGAWILGRHPDGRVRIISLKGQVKDVTESTAAGFHSKHKIANATLSGGRLLSSNGELFPLLTSSEQDASIDKFYVYADALRGQPGMKWIKKLGEGSYMNHTLTKDNIRRISELFSEDTDALFFENLAKIATKFSASKEYGDLLKETESEFNSTPDYEGCTASTRSSIEYYGKSDDNESPDDNLFYAEPGGKGILIWQRQGMPDLRFYPQDVIELAVRYPVAEKFFHALDTSSAGDAEAPHASGLLTEGVSQESMDTIVSFARKRVPALAAAAKDLYASERTGDKFYLDETGRVEWLYYKPDGLGAYISNVCQSSALPECVKKRHGVMDVDYFFFMLGQISTQNIFENDGGADYEAYDVQFTQSDEHDLEGKTGDTMLALLEFATKISVTGKSGKSDESVSAPNQEYGIPYYQDLVKSLEEKISSQGHVTNARDEKMLSDARKALAELLVDEATKSKFFATSGKAKELGRFSLWISRSVIEDSDRYDVCYLTVDGVKQAAKEGIGVPDFFENLEHTCITGGYFVKGDAKFEAIESVYTDGNPLWVGETEDTMKAILEHAGVDTEAPSEAVKTPSKGIKIEPDPNDLKEMKELNEELKAYSDAYYNEGESPVSDYEYDMKFDKMRALEAKTGVILPDSVTQGVGTEVKGKLPKITHPNKLLSLDKTKDVDALIALLNIHPDAKTGVLSWKMDGMTIVANYSGGVLKNAVTRGNGNVGEDVTHNAKFFDGLPRRIPYTGEVSIRGEAVLSYASFDAINEALPEGVPPYKNPRNLAAGMVRRSEPTKDGSIKFYAFHVSFSDASARHDKYAMDLNWLRAQGFNPVFHFVCNPDNVSEYVEKFRAKVKSFEMPTDGLVLMISSISVQDELGCTSHHPKYGIAFKWKDAKEKTILREIEWSASRTGVLTPVAIFDPVELEGTTVKRASVHNLSMLKQLQLGIGDEISIYKANMIIPQIAENHTKSNNIIHPAECPVCGALTAIRKDGSSEFVVCLNGDCTAKNIGNLVHFVKREAMNIDGISEKSIKELVSHGYIKKPVDFYHLSQYPEIAELPGWGKSSYSNLVYAVDNSRNVRLANFIYALGIKNVGRSASAALASQFKSFDAFKGAATDERVGRAERMLGQTDGVGKLMASDIIAYFKNEKNLENVNALLGEVNIANPGSVSAVSSAPAGVPQGSPNCLSGLSFCVTGKVDFPGKRDALINYIESLGGRYSRSVTRGLDYLITNDTSTGTVKNKSAVSLGVKVISEPTFMRMVQELSSKPAPAPKANVSEGDESYDILPFPEPEVPYTVSEESYESYDDEALSDADRKYIRDIMVKKQWGVKPAEMQGLLDVHKEARAKGDYRIMFMIESMLTDANYHDESRYLHNGSYDNIPIDNDSSSGAVQEPVAQASVSAVAGKTFCITGKVNFPGKRAALQDYISDLGGYNASSVTRRVDYLITNDTSSGSAKNKSAQALGVQVISEDEFLRMARG